MVYQIFFSPTGGTQNVAGIISKAWAGEKGVIDLLSIENREAERSFGPEDLCVVAVPSFGGRVPGPALEGLRRMRGGGAKAVLAVVYGNRDFDDTLAELREALEGSGFLCMAAIAAVAEHSIMHEFAHGRPDDHDRRELGDFAARIKESLEHPGGQGRLQLPGKAPYRSYSGVPIKPKGRKGCIKCGKCAAHCPVQAIPRENPASVDKSKCISCMHCVSICPVGARWANKLLIRAASHGMRKSCGGRKANRLFLP